MGGGTLQTMGGIGCPPPTSLSALSVPAPMRISNREINKEPMQNGKCNILKSEIMTLYKWKGSNRFFLLTYLAIHKDIITRLQVLQISVEFHLQMACDIRRIL